MSVRRLFGVIAALALVLAACGDDGGSATSTTSTTAATSSTTAEPDTTSTTETTAPENALLDVETCKSLASAAGSGATLGDQFGTGGDPTKGLQASADFLEGVLDDLPSDAPKDIVDDVKVLAFVYTTAADKAADIDWEGASKAEPAALAAVTEFAGIFGGDDFAPAATALSDFAKAGCAPPEG